MRLSTAILNGQHEINNGERTNQAVGTSTMGGNNQTNTAAFTSANILDSVFNHIRGDQSNGTLNDRSVSVTVAERVVNQYRFMIGGRRRRARRQ
ncbi:hypothetical protein VKT23_006708 [Stygiomarasmius scandens]